MTQFASVPHEHIFIMQINLLPDCMYTVSTLKVANTNENIKIINSKK